MILPIQTVSCEQVYRLRKLIEKMQVSTNCQQKPWLELTYANGYYLLEIGTNCQLDIDAFEQKAKYADTLAKENALPAIDLYKQALACTRDCIWPARSIVSGCCHLKTATTVFT